MHLSTDVYDVFEQVFQGKDNARKVMHALEEAIVTSVHDSWYRTKEELKEEVFSHFATKEDLQLLRTELLGEMKKDNAELSGRIDAVRAELLGKMEKDKAEHLGKMAEDKAELSGRIDALYQKTEKDKAELLLKFEKIDKKFSLYFVLLLFTIIFLNQNALEFIAKIVGVIR